ncbi:MAG: type IV pilus secretin PilQ [Desulfuromonadales bacterium]|nr:type IV pilus secretin PilQ [Desulfuromonadales bacterium]
MTSLNLDESTPAPTVRITTENPVGYRYTVYDSIDPIRIVIDFPGMDVESILSLKNLSGAPVKSIDVSSFDLTSGKLGRVEIVLGKLIKYDIAIEGTDFTVAFAETADEVAASPPVVQQPVQPEPAAVAPTVVEPETSSAAKASASSASASRVTAVGVGASSVVFKADGPVEIFKYFTLGAPARLVLDLYGLKPLFKQRTFSLDGDFSKIRVGAYDDKVRFVFDAKSVLPDFSVDNVDNSVVVAWGSETAPVASTTAHVKNGGPVNVEAVDFKIENGISVLRVTLNDSSTVIKPSQKGDVVGFGVKNASISRALRRSVDASSFPSSIRLITPYTVLVGDQQDVRFAVELKGPSEYELVEDGNTLLFKVVNGPFAEPDPITTQVAVAVPPAASSLKAKPLASASASVQEEMQSFDPAAEEQPSAVSVDSTVTDNTQDEMQVLIGERAKAYSGQRISLVFDNADIRNILQLIAEVSNLNILAGDGVDGTITLRLIDVPWDQALDLILDTKDLGIIRDGNVAKILPKESIRSMDEAKFSAKRTQEKLEDLSTEVIKISYTDLKNVSAPVKDILSSRGKVTEDSRNKQLIVTDIRSNIEKIRALAKILDTPERQVLIEARIVEVSTSANLDLGVNWGISHDQTPGGGGNYSSALSLGGNFNVTPSLGAAGVGSAFQWGQIGVDTTILDLRLGALEAKGDGRVVSNPRIMALNGEKAKITQGTLIPYQTVQDGEISTEFIEAALALEVTPVINPDNTVILVVKASNSAPGASPGQIDKKEAETKMLVANGETMVIGGVFVESDNSSVRGVPFLMDIPLLGNLFKSKNSVKTRTEMMVFVTPRILQ